MFGDADRLPVRVLIRRESLRKTQFKAAIVPAGETSPVTGRANSQTALVLDVIFPNQFLTLGQLVAGGLPGHIENFGPRPDVLLHVAMTIQTPFHVHRIDGKGDRHLIDSPMTTRATNALVNVNAVIEIGELGQVVYARPDEWLPAAKARADRFEHWAVRPNLRMTVHAYRRGRHACKRRFFDRRVTITAINS